MRTAQELGALVRDRRRTAGLTQQQLAERAHVTRQWLARLEKGHERAELDPLLRTLEQLDLELTMQPCAPDGPTYDITVTTTVHATT
ncbi:helix-turn-helix domain-containing protein [Cnuibacter sp. UC19_7]|uniref:helix-turn-helix domain-containing protein n=1 Tax=Cnuibacter sp. UC19_7 TaxID=3350166 RepID=UPI0036728EB7